MTFLTGGVLTLTLIAFSSRKQSDRQIDQVSIDILDEKGNFFIDQLEVSELINSGYPDYVLGLTLGEIDLKALERRIEVNAFVADAQVFHDIKGNLKVKLFQAQPIARILDLKGESRYIDSQGYLLPLNAKHTARVPIVELAGNNDWEKNIRESELGERLWELLTFIEGDRFWEAQIAQVMIDEEGIVTMLPQVTKQEIHFGTLTDFDEKFKKLKVFYKEVLPVKGWNTYEYVDLKFKNQIVCK